MMTAPNSPTNSVRNSNVLSNSLLDDSGFWRNFLEDNACNQKVLDSATEESSSKNDCGTISSTLLDLEQENCLSSKQESNHVDYGITKHQKIISCKNKSYKYIPSSRKKQSYNISLLKSSYLSKIKAHIENCIQNRVPTLLVRDILKAKRYSIFGELQCKNLYEIEGLIFKKVVCRVTVIGIVNNMKTFTFIVSDGTGAISCRFDGDEPSQVLPDSPIIQDFHTTGVSYQTVTSPHDVKRGALIQIIGTLDICNKTLMISKLCEESPVVIHRELFYFNYIRNCYENHIQWKQDISDIYKV